MTATLLLMASPWLAGADPTPVPVTVNPPITVQTPCCGNSAPAVVCCPPAPEKKPTLLERLKNHFKKKDKASPCPSTCPCGCMPSAGAHIYGTPIAPGTVTPTVTESNKPPMEMPAKPEPKATVPKKAGSDAPPPVKSVEPKKLDPNVAPAPKPTESKQPAPVAIPKPPSTPEGLNIPQLPDLPQGPSSSAAEGTPGIVPVSSPKMNGVNSPY